VMATGGADSRPQYQNQSRNGARAACGRRLVAAYPRPLHLYRVCDLRQDSRAFGLGGGNGIRLPASVTSISRGSGLDFLAESVNPVPPSGDI
jgi:hypothetical protein